MLDSLMLTRKAIPGIERKFAGLTIENVTADGSFSGYASLFGEVDLGKDSVEAGAFLKSVRERGPSGIRMLWQHDPNQPIGVWTQVREDKRGLYVEGKLAKGVAKAQEVLELMRSGAVDGLSIGFKTVRAKADGAGVRHIHEADLWEISVVTFPMLPSARVGQVKSAPRAKQMPAYMHQPRLLWHIKANELLLSALKRASPSDYNRRWIENLETETLELKRRSTLYETFQHWLSLKFDPNQPRVPAGNSDGGQWTDGGGGAGGQHIARARPITSRGGRFAGAVPAPRPQVAASKAPDGTPVQLVQHREGSKRSAMPEVVRRNIAAIAKGYVGSEEWASDNNGGRNMCNFFVSKVTNDMGAGPGRPNVTWTNTYPPTAEQWANPKYDIPGWKVLSSSQSPEAGDVVAQRIEYVSGGTGHVMIVTAPNEFIGTGTPPESSGLPLGTIVSKIGLERLGPEDIPHGPLVYRRWVGLGEQKFVNIHKCSLYS